MGCPAILASLLMYTNLASVTLRWRVCVCVGGSRYIRGDLRLLAETQAQGDGLSGSLWVPAHLQPPIRVCKCGGYETWADSGPPRVSGVALAIHSLPPPAVDCCDHP